MVIKERRNEMYDEPCTECGRPVDERFYVLDDTGSHRCCTTCLGSFPSNWVLQERGQKLRIMTPDHQMPQRRYSLTVYDLLQGIGRSIPSILLQTGAPFVNASEGELERDSSMLCGDLGIGLSRVVVFGEVHNQFSPIRSLLLSSLKKLKSLGFTHLGVELLPSDQPTIRMFVEERCDADTCLKTLLIGREASLRKTLAGTFLAILKEAHTQGFKILYLNSDGLRDEIMAQQVKDVLSPGGGERVACLLGSAHGVKRKPPRHPKENEWHSMAEILHIPYGVISIYQTSKSTVDRTLISGDRPTLQAVDIANASYLEAFNDLSLKAFGTLMPSELTLYSGDFDFIYKCPIYDVP